jgi:DNA polymerase elongation subunit (family B)
MYQNIFVTSRTQEEAPCVYVWDDKQGLLILPWDEFNYAYKPDRTGTYKSIYGHTLKKVHFFLRDDDDLFESDLPRETRVLTDLYLDSDEPSVGHKILTLDIEVSSKGGFASLEKADKEVTSIAVHDSVTNEYCTFTLSNKRLDTTLRGWQEHYYTDEIDLLTAFLDYYAEMSPTIITGWNIAYYDIPYLYRRLMRVMGVERANSLSPIEIVKYHPRRQKFQIAGVSTLDYMELYKKFTYTQQPNYRLDSIGKLEVGISKVHYDGTLQELYENDLDKFVEYNMMDTKIVVELDRKMKLITLVQNICHIGHVPYEDFQLSSRFIEGTIVTYLHRKKIICANKPLTEQEVSDTDGEEGFSGAFVKEPNPGLYEWVFSLDLQSLYPSIIMSLNISPETKIGRVLDWDLEKYMKNQVSNYFIDVDGTQKKMTRSEMISFLQENKFYLSSNGILYINKSEQLGIVPEILNKWFADRLEYKKLMKQYLKSGDTEKSEYYDKRQHVQKIFLNSIYGVLGLPSFRFYDLDNALAVTTTGQDIIKTSAKFINNKFQKVLNDSEDHCIYIDTDSVYFSARKLIEKDCSKLDDELMIKETVTIARTYESLLNEFYKSMAEKLFFIDADHRFVIKGETVAKSGFWIAKKRYALLKIYDLETNSKIDKMVIKGLDVVRSSFPTVFSKFMKETLMNILTGKTKSEIDQNILTLVEKLPTVEYLDIARNTSVKNLSEYDDKKIKDPSVFMKGAPMHVKAAISYNRLLKRFDLNTQYTPIMDGDKIKYVLLKKNPYNIDALAIKGFDDPKQIIDVIETYIDYNGMFDAELRNKLEDFYSSLNWGKLPTDVNQHADNFFSF